MATSSGGPQPGGSGGPLSGGSGGPLRDGSDGPRRNGCGGSLRGGTGGPLPGGSGGPLSSGGGDGDPRAGARRPAGRQIGAVGAAPVRLARSIHLLSAFWTFGLALIIIIDVAGRALFSQPLPGTKEIIQNSIVAIAFLQLPLAIYTGSMLRTPLVADQLGPTGRRLLRTFGGLLAIGLFLGLAYSSWTPMIDAWRIGEYEGEGSLRVPTYPVRTLLIITAAFSIFAYAQMIVSDWLGLLPEEDEMPIELTRP